VLPVVALNRIAYKHYIASPEPMTADSSSTRIPARDRDQGQANRWQCVTNTSASS
jgi:hypothetical protein